jgi:ketosteroid isomerase-like protein
MDVLEVIRRGYRALGLGAADDVLAMFDQLGGEPESWVVRDLGMFGGEKPADEVAAFSLFGGLPSHFELAGVTVRGWSTNRRQTRLMVSGHYRVRVRGTWEGMELPFSHVWSFVDGRVTSVLNVLDGVELRRARRAA